MRALLAGLAFVGIVAGTAPASAYIAVRPEAPWCAVMNMGTGDMHWDCSYASIQACTPNVIAGNRGFCNPNPAYRGPVEVQRRHWRRHVRRY